MESVGILYGPLVCLRPFGIYVLWSFGVFSVRLVYFSRFGMLYKEKPGNTGVNPTISEFETTTPAMYVQRYIVG
jgi:hypothetical protein